MKNAILSIFIFFIFNLSVFACDLHTSLDIKDTDLPILSEFNKAIIDKNYKKIEEILKKEPNLINQKSKNGLNLVLKNILDNCDNEIVYFLLQNDLKINIPLQLIELEFCILTDRSSNLKVINTKRLFELGLTPKMVKNYFELHGISSDYLASYISGDDELFLLFLENNYFEFGENFDEIKNLAFDIITFVEQESGGKYHKNRPVPKEIIEFVKNKKYAEFRDKKLFLINKILDKKPLNSLNKSNKFWLELLYKITNDEKIKDILTKG